MRLLPLLLAAAAFVSATPSPSHAAKLAKKYGVTLTSQDHQRRAGLVAEVRALVIEANKLAARSLSNASPNPIADALKAAQLRSKASAKLAAAKGESEYEVKRLEDWAESSQKGVDEALARPRDEGTEALFRYKAYAASRNPAKSPRADQRRGFALNGTPVAVHARDAVSDRYQASRGPVTMTESKLRSDPWSQKMMNRSRPLQLYRDIFGNHIEKMFGELPSNRTWLDVGAGEGVALAQYKQYGGSGRVLGVDFEPSARTRGVEMLGGDIIDVAIPKRAGIRLITDVMGAMAYSTRPDLVLQKYAKVLQRGGKAMIYMPGDGFNFVATKDGRKRQDLIDYLDHVSGFKVERIRELSGGVAIIMRRTSTKFRAPELEILQSESAVGGSTTQARVFRRMDRELGPL